MELGRTEKKLDGVDDGLLRLFQERMATVKEIASYKKNTTCPCSARSASGRF